MHQALTAMVTTVLISPTRMINLSSSDIISNLKQFSSDAQLLTRKIPLFNYWKSA